MKSGKLLMILLWLAFLGSCSKEKISLVWQERPLPVPIDCRDIFFEDPLHGFAVGGKTWNNGYFAETHDGGITWQADSISPWHLYAISYLPQGRAFVSGFGGYLKERPAPASPFSTHNLPYWIPWNDVAYWDEDHGLLVGGQAYQGGKIIRLNSNKEIIRTDSFLQEISAATWTSASTVHAVGYGLILRSIDGGEHWKIHEVNGDFYRAISFPTPETGYIAGSGGSILKTTDGGEHWEKLRNGKSLAVPDLRFRAISFINDQKGYVAGEKGLFWRTTDGGEHWQVVENFPETDLYAVFATAQGGWVAGEGGKVYFFED
jgi:photosystem II stability/assembly factor-like uncharacterized protein